MRSNAIVLRQKHQGAVDFRFPAVKKVYNIFHLGHLLHSNSHVILDIARTWPKRHNIKQRLASGVASPNFLEANTLT